jgi:hypothetical protein
MPLVPPRHYYDCIKAAVWDSEGRNILVGYILQVPQGEVVYGDFII